jgi:hypothetical protein
MKKFLLCCSALLAMHSSAVSKVADPAYALANDANGASDVVNVAYILDDTSLWPTLVSASSVVGALLAQAAPNGEDQGDIGIEGEKALHLFLVDPNAATEDDVDASVKEIFLNALAGCDVSFLPAGSYAQQLAPLLRGTTQPQLRNAILKMYSVEIFPKDVEKVLFLNENALCTDWETVANLYKTSMGCFFVETAHNPAHDACSCFDLALLDLQKMRIYDFMEGVNKVLFSVHNPRGNPEGILHDICPFNRSGTLPSLYTSVAPHHGFMVEPQAEGLLIFFTVNKPWKFDAEGNLLALYKPAEPDEQADEPTSEPTDEPTGESWRPSEPRRPTDDIFRRIHGQDEELQEPWSFNLEYLGAWYAIANPLSAQQAELDAKASTSNYFVPDFMQSHHHYPYPPYHHHHHM